MASSAASELSGVHHSDHSVDFDAASAQAARAVLTLSGEQQPPEPVSSGSDSESALNFVAACLKSNSPPPSCIFRTCAGGSGIRLVVYIDDG